MIKSCGKCKAFGLDRQCEPKCELGYPIDPSTHGPVGPCPKPLTYLDLIECRKEKMEVRS